MKNVFYFILKALFVLKIFKFLSWTFGHLEKTAWLERDKINFKIPPFTIFVKTSILDVWQDSEYASELASKVKDVPFLNQFEYQR